MEKKNNKGKFIKVGNSISFKFSTDGLDYDLQPGSVYTVSYDRYNVSSFAQEINENPKDTFEELFNDMNLSVK